jgi:hypothetical protein
VDDTVNGTSNETGVGELAANLDVVLFIDIDGDGVNESGDGDVQIYGGKLGSIAPEYLQGLALNAGATANISMTWSVATTVNNIIQGDSATLTITFELGQTTAQ